MLMEFRVVRGLGAVLATVSHQLRYVKGLSLAIKHLIVRGKSSSTLVDFRKSWIFFGFSATGKVDRVG